MRMMRIREARLNKQIAQRLKVIREDNGFTQAEVSEALGYSHAYYWHIENNKIRIRFPLLVNLAEILGVSPGIFTAPEKKLVAAAKAYSKGEIERGDDILTDEFRKGIARSRRNAHA